MTLAVYCRAPGIGRRRRRDRVCGSINDLDDRVVAVVVSPEVMIEGPLGSAVVPTSVSVRSVAELSSRCPGCRRSGRRGCRGRRGGRRCVDVPPNRCDRDAGGAAVSVGSGARLATAMERRANTHSPVRSRESWLSWPPSRRARKRIRVERSGGMTSRDPRQSALPQVRARMRRWARTRARRLRGACPRW